jgi:hypothetical protein
VTAAAPPAASAARLRPRELLFLMLASRGYTRAQLVGYFAGVLGMTAEEVDSALGGAARGLGAADLAEAITIARRRGLID